MGGDQKREETSVARGIRGAFQGSNLDGTTQVSPHNPVRWQLIIPHLLFRPYSPLAAPLPAVSRSTSSPYAPNRAFSTVPPSFTSIRIRLALSVRRVITLINKMEVGMRDLRLLLRCQWPPPPPTDFASCAFSAANIRIHSRERFARPFPQGKYQNVRCSHARLLDAWTFLRFIGQRGYHQNGTFHCGLILYHPTLLNEINFYNDQSYRTSLSN